MKILMSLVINLWIISLIMMTVVCWIDNSPNCFDSCSNEVSCSISQQISLCRVEPQQDDTDGPDISGSPVDLKVVKLHDTQYQYINLSWRPPKDGSYNYLRGFLVQATAIAFDAAHLDATGTFCYKVVPVTTWLETHRKLIRKGGVSFFLNCIRTEAAVSLDIMISIHSLPLKADAPKLANITVSIRPEGSATSWNPQLKKWVDPNDVMHLIIENPLREAHFYDVQIQSTGTGHVVYSHMFQTLLGNGSQDNFSSVDPNGKPHFLLRGLSMGDNYTILMDVLDENKTHIPNIVSFETIPFSLNFSRQPKPVLAASIQTLGTNHIIIVGASAVVTAVVFACVVFRVPLKSTTLRSLFRGPPYSPVKFKVITRPTFIPIYCHENDNFVGAVNSHVSLLCKCINVLVASKNSEECPLPSSDFSEFGPTKTLPKYCDVIIYLSPKLKNILTTDIETLGPLSAVDVRCLEALKILRCSDKKDVVVHLVTFACFHEEEMTFIDELLATIFPHKRGEAVEQPLKLASLSSDGWKLENLDQILLSLFRWREFHSIIGRSLESWKDDIEVHEIDQYLRLIWESNNQETSETTSPLEQHSPFVVFDNGSVSFATNVARCVHNLAFRNHESLDEILQNSPRKGNHQKLNLDHDIFHKPQTSGKISQPDPDMQIMNCEIQVNLPYSLLNEPFQNHDYLSGSSATECLRPPSQGIVNAFKVANCQNCHMFACQDLTCGQEINNTLLSTGIPKSASYATSLCSNNTTIQHQSNIYYFKSNSLHNVYVPNEESTNHDEFMKKNRDDINEELTLLNEFCDNGVKFRVVPPSLSYSSCATMESVCERINQVNDQSCWSDSSLSQ